MIKDILKYKMMNLSCTVHFLFIYSNQRRTGLNVKHVSSIMIIIMFAPNVTHVHQI